MSRVEVEIVREYLKRYLEACPSTYANQIKSLRVFFRDFLRRDDVIRSFKFPEKSFKPKNIPTKDQLRKAYESLNTPRERALFLLYATTGLRKTELLKTERGNVALEKRLIIPHHNTKTKNSWVAFFNQEAKEVLEAYLTARTDISPRLIAVSTTSFNGIWRKTSKGAGIKITPQILREWFCGRWGSLMFKIDTWMRSAEEPRRRFLRGTIRTIRLKSSGKSTEKLD